MHTSLHNMIRSNIHKYHLITKVVFENLGCIDKKPDCRDLAYKNMNLTGQSVCDKELEKTCPESCMAAECKGKRHLIWIK